MTSENRQSPENYGIPLGLRQVRAAGRLAAQLSLEGREEQVPEPLGVQDEYISGLGLGAPPTRHQEFTERLRRAHSS
jgi:hypothetical protein